MVLSLPTIIVSSLTSLLMIHCGYPSQAQHIKDSRNTRDEQGVNDEKDCKPRHVHLSFGNTAADMKVMWSTAEKCENCQLLYGQQPWAVHKKGSTKYTHFVEQNKKGLHHLYMSDLQNLPPNTTCFYIPECDGQRGGSFYFQVPPMGEDWVADYLVFGDMGIQTHSIQSVIKEAQSGHYTAVFHVGDFAYDLHKKDGLVGDKFMEMIEPAVSFLPYMTSPGNHEINEDLFSHYRHRFAMPGSDWPIPLNKMWYSFDIGLVHFVSYSTEVFFTNDGRYVNAQKQWLLKDLALANSRRNVTPWVIAYGHRPLYCSTRIGDDCSLDDSLVRRGFEKIFYDMKVDLLLQAHEHNYERLWPMYQGKITEYSYTNVSAPIQIITGAAGSHYGTDPFVRGDQPAWSAFRVGEPALDSYGRMLIQNRTHIWWEQRSTFNHTTIDGIWIIKDDMFEKNSSLVYVPIQFGFKRHMFAIGVGAGALFGLIITFFVIQSIIKRCRRRQFERGWHSPLAQDNDYNDEEEEEEEEEFSQHSYKSSLL